MPTYKNPGLVEFDAVIVEGGGGGAGVDFPYSVLEMYGVKGRVPVLATFDGVPYRGSLAMMGGPNHCLGILKDIRRQTGKDVGDTVHVTIELDDGPREVAIPADVQTALEGNEAANRAFVALPFTNKREYVSWVASAKTAETRGRRVVQMLDMLRRGAKNPSQR